MIFNYLFYVNFRRTSAQVLPGITSTWWLCRIEPMVLRISAFTTPMEMACRRESKTNPAPKRASSSPRPSSLNAHRPPSVPPESAS